MKNYSTKATQHYLALYMDILENYTGDEIYQNKLYSNSRTMNSMNYYNNYGLKALIS